MSFTSVLAQSAVTDLDDAERWYRALFGRGPDARPMDGLLEWHLAGGPAPSGVQVWRDAERAGSSTVVLGCDDLDAVAARLSTAGVEHGGPQPGGGARLVALADPDGNQVVLTGR